MRAHAVRLTPGSDLKEELERLTKERPLRAGCVLACVGSLSRARLRMPGGLGAGERFLSLEGPLEIVSLSGTLCADGLHVHLSLTGGDGACVGGHLAIGCVVHTTVELVVGELEEVEFRRPIDPATGYGELSLAPRGAADKAPPS